MQFQGEGEVNLGCSGVFLWWNVGFDNIWDDIRAIKEAWFTKLGMVEVDILRERGTISLFSPAPILSGSRFVSAISIAMANHDFLSEE